MNETALSSRLTITRARQLLPSLVHDLERNPERVFHIFVRGRLAAEIKAPARLVKGGLAAKRLLSLSGQGARRGGSVRVSEDTDRHLY